MIIRGKKKGFTLVELLVALMVSSVILSAVATLAYATSSAHKATDDMGREQSQLRQVTLRVSDLIRRANQVIQTEEWGFMLWHDLNADGVRDGDETVWIWRHDGSTIRIGESATNEIYQQCANVTFMYDRAAPDTRFVMIKFEMNENGQTQRHRINARLRAAD